MHLSNFNQVGPKLIIINFTSRSVAVSFGAYEDEIRTNPKNHPIKCNHVTNPTTQNSQKGLEFERAHVRTRHGAKIIISNLLLAYLILKIIGRIKLFGISPKNPYFSKIVHIVILQILHSAYDLRGRWPSNGTARRARRMSRPELWASERARVNLDREVTVRWPVARFQMTCFENNSSFVRKLRLFGYSVGIDRN